MNAQLDGYLPNKYHINMTPLNNGIELSSRTELNKFNPLFTQPMASQISSPQSDLAGSASVLRRICSRSGTDRHVKCRLHVKPPTASPPCRENSNVLSLMASIIGQITMLRSVAMRSRMGSNLSRQHPCYRLFNQYPNIDSLIHRVRRFKYLNHVTQK